ncbi:MAG: ribosomal protein S18-alanine N-acetyltransferase [Chloroflexi bacterium]|nr:ribosomal protein S18-alanine N-acetyltransferase [Chloroflexota bacterium]
MRVDHIPAVSAIERLSFPQAWPQNAYRREILENPTAHYIVVKDLALQFEARTALQPLAISSDHDGLFDRIARFLRPNQPPLPVASDTELRSIVGYAGLWLMTDEGHVTTIASHPEQRGKGIGELLLLGLIDRALAVGARWMTLEVRVSNTVARRLYEKYTFREMGVRRRYYSDNNEDALVMWTDALDSPSFLAALDRHEQRLAERLDVEIRLGDRVRNLRNG